MQARLICSSIVNVQQINQRITRKFVIEREISFVSQAGCFVKQNTETQHIEMTIFQRFAFRHRCKSLSNTIRTLWPKARRQDRWCFSSVFLWYRYEYILLCFVDFTLGWQRPLSDVSQSRYVGPKCCSRDQTNLLKTLLARQQKNLPVVRDDISTVPSRKPKWFNCSCFMNKGRFSVSEIHLLSM